MLHDGRRAMVVDPGDAQPVLAALQREGLQLESNKGGNFLFGFDGLGKAYFLAWYL